MLKKMILLMITTACISFAGDVTLPTIVAIGLGAQNPTLDESKFPDITFYYTPGLKATHGETSNAGKVFLAVSGDKARINLAGEPKFLADLNDTHALGNGAYLVIDKNGVVVSQGYRLTDHVLNRKDTEGEKLKDIFKTYIDKDKDGKYKPKEIKFKKDDCLLHQKIPNFELQNSAGETVSMDDITKSGKVTLITFFQLDPTVDVKGGNKIADEKDAGKAAGMSAASVSAVAAMQTQIAIEEELFGVIHLDIMK